MINFVEHHIQGNLPVKVLLLIGHSQCIYYQAGLT